jgi:hypothetical protein
MKETSFPARLHILVPKEGENAIVIRRGPSKQTCILSWNTRTDEVGVSQWLKGRIYERRSDISPDGKYWIYFAMNGRWSSKAKGSWSAIARAPWLKAIALMPKGDCWHGGGLFLDKKRYWLNDGYGHENALITNEVKRSPEPPKNFQYFGGECLTVYYNRLIRDDWAPVGRKENGRHDARMLFEKELPRGWTLRKICHEESAMLSPDGRGCYWDEHVIVSKSGDERAHPDWEWAERVGDALCFATGGRLYRAGFRKTGELSDSTMIHDFNEYKFEKHEAPY